MLGASAFCERAISDQNILLAGVSEQSAIAVTISVGVGVMSGISTIQGIVTQTSTATFISSGAISDILGDSIVTSIGLRARLGTSTPTPQFTVEPECNIVGVGKATKNVIFDQSSIGELLFVNIAPAANETYTTINPSGSESWVEIET
jgi:hypothetical protein